jgi:hypothetical protein
MSPRAIALIIAVLLIGTLAVVVVTGRYAFERLVDREVAGLSERAAAAPASPLPANRGASLPDPVRRYLAYALHDGSMPVIFVRIHQTGVFRGDPDQNWIPVTAEQYFAGVFPAFIWHATVRPASVLWIEARDT